jgi:hypothetical protein
MVEIISFTNLEGYDFYNIHPHIILYVCRMLILANGRSAQAYRLPGRKVEVSWSDFVIFRKRVQRAAPGIL